MSDKLRSIHACMLVYYSTCQQLRTHVIVMQQIRANLAVCHMQSPSLLLCAGFVDSSFIPDSSGGIGLFSSRLFSCSACFFACVAKEAISGTTWKDMYSDQELIMSWGFFTCRSHLCARLTQLMCRCKLHNYGLLHNTIRLTPCTPPNSSLNEDLHQRNLHSHTYAEYNKINATHSITLVCAPYFHCHHSLPFECHRE